MEQVIPLSCEAESSDLGLLAGPETRSRGGINDRQGRGDQQRDSPFPYFPVMRVSYAAARPCRQLCDVSRDARRQQPRTCLTGLA